MNLTDWIGTAGVAILLMAFLMNLVGRLSRHSFSYIFMNIIGAGLACVASVMLEYIPFIVLEGAWTVVSMFALFNRNKIDHELK
jgi:hypothetical protein